MLGKGTRIGVKDGIVPKRFGEFLRFRSAIAIAKVLYNGEVTIL